VTVICRYGVGRNQSGPRCARRCVATAPLMNATSIAMICVCNAHRCSRAVLLPARQRHRYQHPPPWAVPPQLALAGRPRPMPTLLSQQRIVLAAALLAPARNTSPVRCAVTYRRSCLCVLRPFYATLCVVQARLAHTASWIRRMRCTAEHCCWHRHAKRHH